MLLVAAPDGRPKLVTATTGSTNQFQVLDARTGKREFASTTPTGDKLGPTLACDPSTRTVYAASGGKLLAWSFATRRLASLGQAAPSATALYGLHLDSSARVWGGSYPGGITWNYDPRTGKFSSFSALNPRSDYVRALAVWKDRVFAGTGSREPDMVSFPVGRPEQRTIIKLPDPVPTGFVHRIIAVADRLFVFAEDRTNVVRCYIYNPISSQWAGELKSAARAFAPAGGSSVWNVARSQLIRTDTATMAEAVLCPTNLADVRTLLVSGDSIFLAGTQAGEPVAAEYSVQGRKETHRVRPDVLKGSLAVQSLIGSDHGLLYLGGYQGDGLASLDPGTDARWQSSPTAGVSQIEHLMQYDGDRIYIGSYGSAKLFSFNRRRTGTGNAAFTLIATLRKQHMQSRPFAWAAAGGKVLTGTVPEYGLRGGALALIDPATNQLGKVMNGFIPQQSIVGLAGYGDVAYGTTSCRAGYGAEDHPGDACVFAYNARTDKVLWVSYLAGHRDLYSPILMDGVLYVATINGLLSLDPGNGRLRQTLSMRSRTARPGYQSARALPLPGGSKIVHSSGSIVMLIDVKQRTQSVLGAGGFGAQIAVMPDGRIYASYEGNHIAELHAGANPTITSMSDLVTINSAGELMVTPSNGAGGYGKAVRRGAGWNSKTIQSFHLTDWNGDGLTDILIQRSNGNLELSRGRVNGGFDTPVNVASGWAGRKIAVGQWTDGIYPTVIGINADGQVRRHPVGANGSIGAGHVLANGWKSREIAMLDMRGTGRQGLVFRSGAKLYFQPSNGKGAFQGLPELVAAGGWSDTTAMTSVTAHYRGRRGLLSVKRNGTLQYVSADGNGFSGIITYPMDLRSSWLAGSRKF